MGARPEAIASGMCCNVCGTIVSMTSPIPGAPRTCGACLTMARWEGKAKRPTGPWKPRKRSWPNGRVYWIVGDGKGQFLCGKGGGQSKFYDKDEAQHWADEHNLDD